jgi:hypothetical protein
MRQKKILAVAVTESNHQLPTNNRLIHVIVQELVIAQDMVVIRKIIA